MPAVAALTLWLGAPQARGVESDPLPVPEQTARAEAIRLYNEGVVHLLAQRWHEAQDRFETALTRYDGLAEAHNNLAYVLRQQGAHNFPASLHHYNRALEINPKLAHAYAYRGTLFMLQGQPARARQDLERLRDLDAELAALLQKVIDGSGDTAGGRSGVMPQFDY